MMKYSDFDDITICNSYFRKGGQLNIDCLMTFHTQIDIYANYGNKSTSLMSMSGSLGAYNRNDSSERDFVVDVPF